MNKIKLIGDSTLDLSPELCKQYDIDIIPLTVLLGGASYLDSVDITPAQIFEHVDKTGELPKTAAINAEIYKDQWKPYLDQGYDVIHFNIGSTMSMCNQSANIAAQELGKDRVFVVDTLNLSTGSALLALYASDLVKQGLSASEIAEKCRKRVDKVQASFVLDRLNSLYKGGRCSGLTLLAANVLNIKPSIRVTNGKMAPARKYVGKFATCAEKYATDLLNDFKNPDLTRVFITHTKVPQEIHDKLHEIVAKRGFKEILHTTAGCTISSHCGPCTIGVLFINDGE